MYPISSHYFLYLESLKDYRKSKSFIKIKRNLYILKRQLRGFASDNVRESTGGSLAITIIISICNKYM